MSPTTSLLITGAGSGIGRATALRLSATRGDRPRLVLVGRRPEALDETARLLEARYPGATPPLLVPCDLARSEAVETGFSALSDIGPVVGAALCAGGLAPTVSTGRGTFAVLEADWLDHWRLNVLTAVLTVAALEPHLADDARLVVVGSIAGARGGGAYGSAKAALLPWVRDLATRLGPRGITANLVAPGYVADTEFFGDAMTAARHDRLVAETVTGRPGRPENVAAVISHLLSADAGHVTGQAVHVNGGAWLGG